MLVFQILAMVQQNNYSHAGLGQIYEKPIVLKGLTVILQFFCPGKNLWIVAQQHSFNLCGVYLGLSTFDIQDTRNSFEALSANFGNLMSISQVDSLSYSWRRERFQKYDNLAFGGIYVKCFFGNALPFSPVRVESSLPWTGQRGQTL